jgi:hypothetical protein
MTGQNVVRLDSCIVKKPISRLEHRRLSGSLWKGGTGLLSQDGSNFNQALGTPDIPQLGVSKFSDRPGWVVIYDGHLLLIS